MSAIPTYIYRYIQRERERDKIFSQIGIWSVFFNLSFPKFVEVWSVFQMLCEERHFPRPQSH